MNQSIEKLKRDNFLWSVASVLGWAGSVLSALSFFTCLIADPNDIGSLFVLLLLLGIGCLTVYQSRKGKEKINAILKPLAPPDIGNQILSVAHEHKGKVTAAETALVCRIPYEMAEKELERLTSQGACQVRVGEKGIIVYYFPEFEDDDYKKGPWP